MGRKVKLEEYTELHDIYTKVDKFATLNEQGENGCINWTGSKHRQGYGIFGVIYKDGMKRTMEVAHRIVARMMIGRALEKGESVIHTCSNPLCVNPDHLIVGTLSDRNRIMYANGKGAKTRNRKPKEKNDVVQS
jgi:hypothetical protein